MTLRLDGVNSDGGIALTHTVILPIPTPTPEQRHKPSTSIGDAILLILTEVLAKSGQMAGERTRRRAEVREEGAGGSRCLIDKNRTCSHCAR